MKTICAFLLTSFSFFALLHAQHNAMQKSLYDLDTFESNQRRANTANVTPSFRQQKKVIAISDSTFLISGRILMNLTADAYKITFSLSQQEPTIKGSHEIIDQHIEKFLKSLEQQGIVRENTYVDLTGQYPVYGYDIERKTATQQLEGYEVNKNVIIRYKDLSMTEKLLNIAAEHDIHDAAKIEYIIHDTGKLYEQMFSEAIQIINRKKTLYLSASNLKIQDQAMVYREQFQFVFPQERYQKYQSFVSSELKGYQSRKLREQERKKTTYFYEGMNFSGFDTVINPDKVQVGLQLIFQLEMKYERVKN